MACVLGCRRAPLAGDKAIDAGGPPPIEAGRDVATDLTAGSPDAADAPSAADGSDAPSAPVAPCGALRALAAMGPFTNRHAMKALFSPDRSLVVVQAVVVDPMADNPPPELLLLPLPGGPPQRLITGVRDAEWLGNTRTLLVTLATGDLAVVPIDGTPPRTIAHRTCAHLAAPDGSRVFVKRDCAMNGLMTGALDEVDSATGDTVTRAASVTDLAISPGGQFAAYLTAPATAPGSNLHVLNGSHDEAVSETAASTPYFVSEQALLFVADNPLDGTPDIFVHVPGSGAVSRRIGQGRNFGYDHYRVSPDGALVLAVAYSSTPRTGDPLFAIRIADGTEQLLASDTYPFQLNQIGLTPFVFTPDGRHVIYLGATAAEVRAVAPDGSTSIGLSNGFAFAASAFADRVVTLESLNSSGRARLHVVSAATGNEMWTVDADAIMRGPTFVPGDRGLLYVQSPAAGEDVPWQLVHLSFTGGNLEVIGLWQNSNMPLGSYPAGDLGPGYPVDPTGCFTIVDSDLPDSKGTSLVVLPDAPE